MADVERCREDYVHVSNDDQGVWTFCDTCPRRAEPLYSPVEPCCDEGMTCLECDPDATFAEYANPPTSPASPGGES